MLLCILLEITQTTDNIGLATVSHLLKHRMGHSVTIVETNSSFFTPFLLKKCAHGHSRRARKPKGRLESLIITIGQKLRYYAEAWVTSGRDKNSAISFLERRKPLTSPQRVSRRVLVPLTCFIMPLRRIGNAYHSWCYQGGSNAWFLTTHTRADFPLLLV